MSPETLPLKRLNENAVLTDSSPKRSKRRALKAEEHCYESASEHIGFIASRKGEGSGFSFKTSICKGSTQEYVKPSQDCGADKEEVPGLTASCAPCIKSLRTAIRSVRSFRWLLMKRRNGSCKTKRMALESLPLDIRENIFLRLPFKEIFFSKVLSKSCEELAGNDAFLRLRGNSGEGSFTAINFFLKDKAWQCTGFDLQAKAWRRLPTFSCLPTPDASLFKDYSVCGNGSFMCANVSKLLHKEELVVFNPLTGETRQLPSLHYPRHPVLIHILVDSATGAYRVIAAGSSSSSGEEHLSKKVEVFSSQTSQWEVASDLPGPEFGLNEHQTGVCVDGVLYFIAFLEADGRKGVVAFDLKKGKWLKDRSCSVPFSSHSNALQLVETGGNVYLFSEQELGGTVEHCIDELDLSGSNGCELKSMIRVKKTGGRGLLVYPEYICVPYGNGKLCIFNTIKRDGLVYDVRSGMQCEVLEQPPVNQRGDNFFSLNPVSFTLQPNFVSKP